MNVAFLIFFVIPCFICIIMGSSIWMAAVSHERWGAKNEFERDEDRRVTKISGRIVIVGLIGILSILLWHSWSMRDSKVSYKTLQVDRVSKKGRLYDVANWNGTDINLNDRFGRVFEDDDVVFVKSRTPSWGLTYSDELVAEIDE